MNYYIAIADIHGDIKKLEKALSNCENWIEYNTHSGTIKETDKVQFLFLGDYIDRSDHPKEVIQLVKKYVEEKNAICLLGNHDQFLIGTAEESSITFENGHTEKLIDLWRENGGVITCIRMFGRKMGQYYEDTSTDLNLYKKDILNSEEYKFFKEHGKLKYVTETCFFSHAPQSDPKNYTDVSLTWERSSDYSKTDAIFKVPDNKLISVHGHMHGLSSEIIFPRITNYKHGGRSKTVVMADCGCGCLDIGMLHPVIIRESLHEENGVGNYADVFVIL